jgi:hypothetical protein
MIPSSTTFYDKYPELDVTMLGIAVGQDTPETVRPFVHEQDINIFTGSTARTPYAPPTASNACRR